LENSDLNYLTEKIESYLKKICVDIQDRHVGSKGNQDATAFFEKTIKSFGFDTETPQFDCIDWTFGEIRLEVNNESIEAFASPYSLECNIAATLTAVSSIEELKANDLSNKIILIHGELAKEQLMPKNFPFYNPDFHKKIIGLLEQKKPAAIIAATGMNPDLVGAMYPFPLFEDGDFNIPSAYIKDIDAKRMLKSLNKNIKLVIDSKRIPSKGNNVIARKGDLGNPRIIICAHIDAKKGTPGALDDGGGTATLLALAELLKNYNGSKCLEIIAFNGEDYYDAPGQKQYLEIYKSTIDKIYLAINLDLVGYLNGKTEFSFYEFDENIKFSISEKLKKRDGISEGEAWYQGDHMIFILNQRPAMTFISENYKDLMQEIVHTKKDTIALVDYHKLAELALCLKDIISFLTKVEK